MADSNLMTLTAEIVASHVANNDVATGDVPTLIATTYDALAGLGTAEAPAETVATFESAVSVRKSLADPKRIVSMIDGKPYSSLTRHLGTHGLTPTAYRERYGLKADYPMVAPGFSAARRDISLKHGFGRKKAAAPPASASEPVPVEATEAKKPGRPKLKLSGGDALAKVRRGSAKQEAQDDAELPTRDEQQQDV